MGDILSLVVEAIRAGDIPGVQLRCRALLPLADAEAWRWLVEPEGLQRWLAATAAVDPGAGGYLELLSRDPEGRPRHERGQTRAIAPPRRWVLAFQRLDAGWTVATRLTIEVEPRPGGCELSVLQEGFEQLPLSRCLTIWEEYRRRWREALDRLAAAASA